MTHRGNNGAMRRIALLTSGGDAPGMNAAIRAVVRTTLALGCEAVGVRRGFQGLVRGEMVEMSSRSVADILQRGGTMLHTARCPEFMEESGRRQALQQINRHRIDGIIVIGGNGSLRGALSLHREGVPVVGIPATIDNDVPLTDVCIGFDTAINTALDGIDKIRDTATSHERTYVVEVMGRHAGHIALYAGTAGGAECILVPELPADLDQVVARVRQSDRLGKAHSIIIVAEGCAGDPASGLDRAQGESPGFRVGRYIRENTPFEVRVVVLGHLQRGGKPTARDRIAATVMGAKAVRALVTDGLSGVMVGLQGEQARPVPLEDVLSAERPLNEDLSAIADLLASL